jgi:putative ABC transport system permease protein
LIILLSKKFFFNYVLALTIATPAAYYLVSKWLDNFSYATPIDLTAFGISCVVVFGLALTIILIQALQQMRKRALDALRSE